MTHIIGQHDCKADSKGRVLLPISLKNQLLPVLKDGFVIKRSVFQQCLELYPKVGFDQLMQKVMKKSKINRKYDAFCPEFCGRDEGDRDRCGQRKAANPQKLGRL